MGFLKNYKIILTTKTPIHIGMNCTISKKDYIIEKDKVLVFDNNKLIDFAFDNNLLDSLEKYYRDYKMTLKKWFNENNISKSEQAALIAYKADIHFDIKDSNIRNINSFIKDVYKQPYVPGSSLKGTLKNSIFSYIIANYGIKQKVVNDIENIAKNSKNRGALNREMAKVGRGVQKCIFEQCKGELFSDEIDSNFMRYIRISDSKPLRVEDLIICGRTEMFVNKPNIQLPIYIECIKPNTKIEFDMTIDQELVQFIDDHFIMDAINHTLDIYNTKYLSNYSKVKKFDNNIIFIGGITGFHIKTVLKDIFEKEKLVDVTSNILAKVAPRHKHKNDYKLKVSPRAVKINNSDSEINHMGACSIEIIPK